jgi:hypothetical protein
VCCASGGGAGACAGTTGFGVGSIATGALGDSVGWLFFTGALVLFFEWLVARTEPMTMVSIAKLLTIVLPILLGWRKTQLPRSREAVRRSLCPSASLQRERKSQNHSLHQKKISEINSRIVIPDTPKVMLVFSEPREPL